VQKGKTVVGAPHLEGPCFLEVFEFEEDVGPKKAAEGGGWTRGEGRITPASLACAACMSLSSGIINRPLETSELAGGDFDAQGFAGGGDLHFSEPQAFRDLPRSGAGKPAVLREFRIAFSSSGETVSAGLTILLFGL
jgi:hypothetical protein